MHPSRPRIVASLVVALATVVSGLTIVPSSARAAGANTAFVLDSEPGDWVGSGQQWAYTPSAATFVNHPYGPGVLSLEVWGTEVWSAFIAAPTGGALAVGTYENAQGSADATHPGLNVSGNGHGCSSTGRFVISEIDHDVDGNITAIALTFEQHCDGGEPALFGELRYQASTGYKLLTVAPESIDFGSAGIGTATPTQTVHLTSSGTVGVTLPALSIAGASAGDFSIASETCPVGLLAPAAACDVTVKATPSATGARTAQLVIGSDSARGQRTVALTATGVVPVSAVGWATTRSGPAYSWNLGQSLARTVSSTTTYLHATYTTDRVSGAWVDDNGPYAGINYVRTRNNGVSFTTPKRLNPAKQHGSRGSLAASGKFVYATWISTSRWIAYKGTAPRVLYLRRNSNHGSSTAWNTTKRLTSLTGRVDYPTVAAAGSNVYVAYTDSGAGSVKVKISRDRAASWSTVTLGTTSAGSATAGRYGMPRIAASGNTVIVSWLANANGAVRARVSIDAGRTWSTTGAMVGTSTDIPAVAASGSRAAVAWTDGTSAVVRTWSAGAWSAPKATIVPAGATYTDTYGPAIALNGTAGVGVAWTGCVTACTTWTSATRANLVWSESKDNGASWFAGQVLGSPPTTTARRYNDYPSILWPSATRRHVLWNAGTAGTNSYRIVMRTGLGVVDAATFAAASRTSMAIDRQVGDPPPTQERSPGTP
jgi:hypothetical protein